MEFDCNVSKLEGTLLSLNRRGLLQEQGNAEAVSALRDIFCTVEDNEAKLKMVLFMILNTNLVALENSESVEPLNLFMCITPKLSHNRILEIIWALDLQSCLCLVIENFPSSLLNQLLGQFTKNENFWLRNEANFEKLCKIWSSLFVKIHNTEESVTLAYYFEKICQKIYVLLIGFMNSSNEKEIPGVGRNLLSFFETILFMLKLYNKKNYHFEKHSLFDIFDNLNLDIALGNADLTLNCASETCLKIIFKMMPRLMEFLTVDLWMSLVDVTVDKESTSHAQQLIGEVIYQIYEEASPLFPTSLNCLTSCKIKPKSEADKISESGLNEIIKNVENGKKVWFKALVNYKEKPKNGTQKAISSDTSALDNEMIIDCLADHLDLADSDDIDLITTKCLKLMSLDESDIPTFNIKKLLIKILKKYKWDFAFEGGLQKYFQSLASTIFTEKPQIGSKLELTSVDSNVDAGEVGDRLTEIFNKISCAKDIDMGEIASLCLESRRRTLTRLCQLGLSNSKQRETCLEAVRFLKEAFTSVAYPGAKDSVLEFVLKELLMVDAIEYNEEAVISFFKRLDSLKLVNWSFYQKLLELLLVYLKSADYDRVTLLLKLIEGGAVWTGLEDTRQKLCFLVFMSQIVDGLNWCLEDFSTGKADGLVVASNIVARVIAATNDNDKGSLLMWALDCISKCSVITQSYFCDLWFKFGYNWSSSNTFNFLLLTICHSSCLNILDAGKSTPNLSLDDVKDSFVASLAVILSRLPFPDWQSIFSSLESMSRLSSFQIGNETWNGDFYVIDIFSRALYLLTLEFNKNKKISPGYEFCLRNFGSLVKINVQKSNGPREMFTLEKMVFFLAAINSDEDREKCYLILSPVINDLIESRRGTSKDHSDSIDRLLRVLNVKKAEEAANKDRSHVNDSNLKSSK
ncbi:hypothetical protein RUM44_009474 [Polyplax serrata]|uniref:Uncharacterized protein n=1 Tax=Polyplax serrata TaxID=468196 RepID=A0ABR1AST4_POLSC